MAFIKLREYNYYMDKESDYYKSNKEKINYSQLIPSKNEIMMESWKWQKYTIYDETRNYKATFEAKRPIDCFGWESWKFKSCGSDVDFYHNDVKIFTVYSSREPIFYTKDNITRVLIINGSTISIYNMDGVEIKENIPVGPDCFVDFIKVSNKYAIGLTEEGCTRDPFGCIWDLDTLIFGEETDLEKFYSNHRTPITLTGNCDWCNYKNKHVGHARYVPIVATPNGFIVWDTLIKKQMENIVTYEDAYTGEFEFDPAYVDPLIYVSQMCGRSVEELEDEMFKNNGKLSFTFSHNDGPN